MQFTITVTKLKLTFTEKNEKTTVKKETKSEAAGASKKSSKRAASSSQSGGDVEAKRAKTGDSIVCMDKLKELLRLKPITIAKILKKFKQDGVDKSMLGKLIGDKLRLLKLKKIEINGKMHLHLKD